MLARQYARNLYWSNPITEDAKRLPLDDYELEAYTFPLKYGKKPDVDIPENERGKNLFNQHVKSYARELGDLDITTLDTYIYIIEERIKIYGGNILKGMRSVIRNTGSTNLTSRHLACMRDAYKEAIGLDKN